MTIRNVIQSPWTGAVCTPWVSDFPPRPIHLADRDGGVVGASGGAQGTQWHVLKSTVRPFMMTTGWTFSCWLKMVATGSQPDHRVIASWAGGISVGGELTVYYKINDVTVRLDPINITIGGATSADTDWHHIFFSYRLSDHMWLTALDGVQTGTPGPIAITPPTGVFNAMAWEHPGGGALAYARDMVVKEMTLWDRPLLITDAVTLWNSGTFLAFSRSTPPFDIAAWHWKLDESTGSTRSGA